MLIISISVTPVQQLSVDTLGPFSSCQPANCLRLGWKDFPEFRRQHGRQLFVSGNFNVDAAFQCCFTSRALAWNDDQ